jgi:hypothetical protein
MTDKMLLLTDGTINLALGLLLGIFPKNVISFLGVPLVAKPFYASILGGVLFGIGLALLIERSREKAGLSGLGLGGAIAINLCGGVVLGLWLLSGKVDVPLRGQVIMWSLVGILFLLSAIEVVSWHKGQSNLPAPGHGEKTRRTRGSS